MKKILWFIAIVIIISFGFLGTASLLDYAGQQAAGRIFGRKVSIEDFQKSLDQARIQAILRYGDNFDKIQSFLDLEAQAWDRLILLREARRQRIRVSDEDVIREIQEKEFFKRDGKFDPYLYQDILRYIFKTKPRIFEEGTRESLMFNKLYEKVTNDVETSDEEIRDRYEEANEKVQIDYVLFAPEKYRGEVDLTEKDIRDYYAEHKETFHIPETVNIEYLRLPYPDEKVFGEQDSTVPQESGSKGTPQEIKAKANLLSMELLLTPNLTEIGKKYDLEVEETGFFSREQPNLKLGWSYELLQKAFGLKDNEISQPIETVQGYYILRRKKRRDAYTPDYLEAHDKVRAVLLDERSDKIAHAKATEYVTKIREAAKNMPEKSFRDIAKELNLAIQETQLFNRGQYLPNIGISRNFQDSAFALTDTKEIASDTVETPIGYATLNVHSYQPVDDEIYAQEKEKFAAALVAEKKLEAFNDFIAQLKTQANLQSNLPKKEEQPSQPQG